MKRQLLAFIVACAIPFVASAHKPWIVPSQATVNGNDVWVSFDAAVSNDLFFPDHFPLALDSIAATAPDGSGVPLQNALGAKYRSTFDLDLKQQGTYRIASVNSGLMARWDTPESLAAAQKAKAEGKPPGGEGGPRPGGFLRNATPEDIATKIPKDAKNVQVSESFARIETFVTNGSPTPVKPLGKGLELVPVTAPSDLVTGEAAKFKLAIDGKPAAGIDVQAIRGGTRYRDTQDTLKATSDKDGNLAITFPQAGVYWLSANTEDDKTSSKLAKSRRLSYVATLEVLPQ